MRKADVLINHTTSIKKNLETQMGQLLQALNQRPQGSLPSDSIPNPKGNEKGREEVQVLAINLRSGTKIEKPKEKMSFKLFKKE